MVKDFYSLKNKIGIQSETKHGQLQAERRIFPGVEMGFVMKASAAPWIPLQLLLLALWRSEGIKNKATLKIWLASNRSSG